jgi:hypothetical protein
LTKKEKEGDEVMKTKRVYLPWLMAILFIATVARAGASLSFDGVDDYLEIVDDPLVSGAGKSLTVEAWIRPTNAARGSKIISKYKNWNNKDWGLLLSNERYLGFGKESWSQPGCARGNWYVWSSQPVPLDRWSHAAFVFDNPGDQVRLYLDGALVGERTLSCDLPVTDAPVWIGGPGPFYYDRGGGMFAGCIDDVRIWNAARTAEQLSAKPLSDAGLIGRWSFDAGSGQTVLDSSGYGRHVYRGSTPSIDDNDPAWSSLEPSPIPAPSALLLAMIGIGCLQRMRAAKKL